MSQSASNPSESVDSQLAASDQVDLLVDQGRSWSGNERNCAFLNTRGQQFATISAASGFDFDEDSRAISFVDWDFDGDLDLWMTSRTAPQVRFLRNELGQDNHFLSIRLEGNGTTTNRDAIGARVTLTLDGESLPISRSLRAGEGFLSQNSKWLSFGLGNHGGKIHRVQIKWPNGNTSYLRNLKADRHYHIKQAGKTNSMTQCTEWQPPRIDLSTSTEPAVQSQTESPGFVTWIPQQPLFPLTDYREIDKADDQNLQERYFSDPSKQAPLLVVLWSRHCERCAEHLPELVHHRDKIGAENLRILALSVDDLNEKSKLDFRLAQEFLAEKGWQANQGMLDQTGLSKIELLRSNLFEFPLEMVTPMSWLLNSEGKVVAVYTGEFMAKDLISDLQTKLPLIGRDALRLVSPFSGRWSNEAEPPDFEEIADAFRGAGHEDDFKRYTKAWQEDFPQPSK